MQTNYEATEKLKKQLQRQIDFSETELQKIHNNKKNMQNVQIYTKLTTAGKCKMTTKR